MGVFEDQNTPRVGGLFNEASLSCVFVLNALHIITAEHSLGPMSSSYSFNLSSFSFSWILGP